MIKNNEDLKFICVNLSNLSGLPVRVYKKEKQTFYYSTIKFVKDPFLFDEEKALKINDDVYYYQSLFSYYYGIINFQNNKIIVGPTRQLPVDNQELKSYAFSLGVIMSEVEEFVSQMKSLIQLPLMSLLQILCMVYFAMTGKKKTIESITIHDEEQASLINDIEKRKAENVINLDNYQDVSPYNAFDTENRLLDMIMRGDLSALHEFIASIPTVRSGTVANEQLRQSKNIFIVTATLVSRAAIRGGMDITTSLSMSDSYIQKCELATEIDQITDLNYRMVLDYAERVNKIRFGLIPSKLVIDVSNYIQKHLSSPIKEKDIANALYMGRSRLSTNFKKEAGINLSTYITQQKIDEAKRLLRYSDKTFSSISLYLGFSSQSHFTKVFKDFTELTPSEYRQLHKHY